MEDEYRITHGAAGSIPCTFCMHHDLNGRETGMPREFAVCRYPHMTVAGDPTYRLVAQLLLQPCNDFLRPRARRGGRQRLCSCCRSNRLHHRAEREQGKRRRVGCQGTHHRMCGLHQSTVGLALRQNRRRQQKSNLCRGTRSWLIENKIRTLMITTERRPCYRNLYVI